MLAVLQPSPTVAAAAAQLLPRLLHILLALCIDALVYGTTKRLWQIRQLRPSKVDRSQATAALASPTLAAACSAGLSSLSWLSLYAGARPVTNSLETALCMLGVILLLDMQAATGTGAGSPWGWRAAGAGAAAALAACVRPTAAAWWAGAGAWLVIKEQHPLFMRRTWFGLKSAALLGAVVAVVAHTCIDTLVYGRFVVTPFAFVAANAGAGIDALYGSYPPLWYLYAGLPAALALHAPLALTGRWWWSRGVCSSSSKATATPSSSSSTPGDWLLAGSFTYVAALSLVAHKEHRFLMPLLPVVAVWAGSGLAQTLDRLAATSEAATKVGSEGTGTASGPVNDNRSLRRRRPAPVPAVGMSPSEQAQTEVPPRLRLPALVRTAAAVFIALNVGAAGYLTVCHQRGPVAASEWLSSSALASSSSSSVVVATTHYLLPCHTVPIVPPLGSTSVLSSTSNLLLECAPPSRLGAAATTRRAANAAAASPSADANAAWEALERLAWPRCSESDALEASPVALLQALYGPHPSALSVNDTTPVLCVSGQGDGKEGVVIDACTPASAPHTGPRFPGPGPTTFALTASAWASSYVPGGALALATAGVQTQRRALPSRLVTARGYLDRTPQATHPCAPVAQDPLSSGLDHSNGVSSPQPTLRQWLAAQGYVLAAACPHSRPGACTTTADVKQHEAYAAAGNEEDVLIFTKEA